MPRRKATESIEDVVIGTSRSRSGSRMFTLGLVLTGIVIIGGAVMIGKSDTGAINVAATIQESNETRSADGGEQVNVVSQTFQNMPNGGLVPQENQPTETPAQGQGDAQVTDTASTTATTTEEEITESSATGESTETTE